MTTWHVYQLRSDTELLYVGYSRWPKKRLSEHKRTKAWWPEVTGIWSEQFSTEDEARQREKDLWASGRPKYNKQTPLLTPEEKLQSKREYNHEYLKVPERRRLAAARKLEWQQRKRPTTVAGRRAGARWQQTGPGLF